SVVKSVKGAHVICCCLGQASIIKIVENVSQGHHSKALLNTLHLLNLQRTCHITFAWKAQMLYPHERCLAMSLFVGSG
ncbi:hypothetical protein ACJX0J_020526, partial [Zea mays]